MARRERDFDIRTIDRLVRDGEISEEEYQAYLENLPDVSEKAAPMEAEFERGVLEEKAEDEAEED